MSLLQRVCITLGVLGLAVAMPALVSGQTTNYYGTQGGEYAPVGNLPGDQVWPALSLNSSGGFLVWQDNISDGSGLGISAVRLNQTFDSPFGIFRVNQQGANDQENARVAMLQNGGAAFVWQGGPQSFQHIYARFLSVSNTWVTGDVMVNTPTNFYQLNPAISALANGNVIIVWSSWNQDGSMQGVYAQQMGPTGNKVGNEIPITQFTSFNQRTPAVAGLPAGGFVVAWISEQQRLSIAANQYGSMDVYARLFDSSGAATTNEFLINTATNVCANPAVAAAVDGSFAIAWSQKDTVVTNNSWDVFIRTFSSVGTAGSVRIANTQRYGDQFGPRISALGTDYLVAWTSLAQDGSREGVYGQFFQNTGTTVGGEFRVNTSVINQQMQPVVASDGVGSFLAVWTSYVGGANSFDLYAQRYANTLQPLNAPGAPFVTPVDPYTLVVTWPALAGFSVDHYTLYADGSPANVTNTMWEYDNYNPGSTHTFQLGYVLTDGRVSPFSAVVTNKTWGADRNFDGLPDDWQTNYWGPSSANWPGPNVHLGGPNGPTVLQVFLWGANPLDPSTWLKMSVTHTGEGFYLNWNTLPGSIYQVNISTDFTNWTPLGAPRFAAGNTDSVFIGPASKSFYRVQRIRF